MTKLPPEIGQLSALRALDLGQNQLACLPPEIGQLSASTSLFLQYNRLQALPEQLLQLSQLEDLTLHGNDALGLSPEVLGTESVGLNLTITPPANPQDLLKAYFALKQEQSAVE